MELTCHVDYAHASQQGLIMSQVTVPARKEKKNDQIGLRLSSELKDRLAKKSHETGYSMNEIVVRAVQREMSGGGETAAIDAAMQQKRCKYLAALPCGPLSPALAEASDYIVSRDMAELLDIQNGDFISVMNGDSMTGAGIESNDLVAFRPLPENRVPFNGDICAVQVHQSDGAVSATVKHWHNTQPPHLTDGDGHTVELPADTERLVPLGIAKALFRRL